MSIPNNKSETKTNIISFHGFEPSAVTISTSTQAKKSIDEEIEDLYQEVETRDHIIPIHRLCEKLRTDVDRGVSSEVAEEVLREHGPNSLTPPKLTPEYVKFFRCMFEGFAALLWICAFFCFIIWALEVHYEMHSEGIHWFGLIIIGICLISGIFAYVQESKNTKVMDSFNKMVPVKAAVI